MPRIARAFRNRSTEPTRNVSRRATATKYNLTSMPDAKRAKMIEIECVARGYISGSGWKEYRQNGTVCGIPLPAGLKESDSRGAPDTV